MRLLLAHGADLNAQDDDGNGLLHLLVKGSALAVLLDVLDGPEVRQLDFALLNSAGQTAVDLAAIRLAQLPNSGTNSTQKRIHRLMTTHKTMWIKSVLPVMLACMQVVLPVTDVAKLAMGYVDGSGRPFATAVEVEAEHDEDAGPAAATAAVQS